MDIKSILDAAVAETVAEYLQILKPENVISIFLLAGFNIIFLKKRKKNKQSMIV